MSKAADPPPTAGARTLRRELELLLRRLEEAPLALAAFAPPQADRESGPCPLGSAIRERMLSCDSLETLEAGHYALVLPGAGLFKALALVEEILKAAPESVHAVGIAVGTGKAPAESLLEQAVQALRDALRTGESVRAYRAAAHTHERDTLVHSNEKRFLFQGGE